MLLPFSIYGFKYPLEYINPKIPIIKIIIIKTHLMGQLQNLYY